MDDFLNAIVASFTLDSQKIFKSVKKESLLIYARVMTVKLIIPATLIASKGYSVIYLFFVADLVCARKVDIPVQKYILS